MKTKRIITAILLSIGLIVNAQGQVSLEQIQSDFKKETNNIEQKCSKILEDATSETEMGSAVADLEKGYENLMTKYYNLLLSNIKAEDKEIIIQSQNNWIKYKENEMKLINKVYWEYDGFGSMGRLSVINHSQELTKARTTQLYQYLCTLLEY